MLNIKNFYKKILELGKSRGKEIASHCLWLLFMRKGENVLKAQAKAKVALIAIILLGLILEIFVFNFTYLQRFVLRPLTIDVSSAPKKDLQSKDMSTYISTSGDPYILVSGINKFTSNISLKLEYQGDGNSLQVYYTDATTSDFSEKASSTLSTNKEQHVYTFSFRAPKRIKDLRIDLVNRPNEIVKIDNITINNFAGPFTFNPLRLGLVYLMLIFTCLLVYGIKLYGWRVVKYRYLIALIIFIFLVAGKIHGSSIAQWDNALTAKVTESKSSVLFGTPRPIRSDEWLVHTPWILSQVASNYPIINNNIRSDGQNMLLTSVPTRSLDLLGKPFYWGFFLLGKEYGLSWYWVAKFLLLFLLSYELAMLLTSENESLSLLGALWISLGPVVQWWFDTPAAVVELIIYSQAMVVTALYFVRSNKLSTRLLFMVLMTMSVIGYTSVIYPAIQVPLGYLTLVFLGYIFYTNRKSLALRQAEIFFGIGCLALVGASIGMFVYNSLPSIKVLLGTAYPGARFSTGGDFQAADLQLYLLNWLLPFRDLTTFSNNCEVSVFYNFMPAILLVFFLVYKRTKEHKGLALALFAYLLFQLSWLLVSYPRIMAKLTLFSFVTGPRLANIVFSLTALYLSLWLIAQLAKHRPLKIYQAVLLCIPIGALYYYSAMNTPMHEYLSNTLTKITIVFFLILNYLLLRGRKNLFIFLMLGLILVSGVTVNPISRGTGALDSKQVVVKMQEMNVQDPNQKWVAVNSGLNGQLLVAEGLKTFNGVHFYPDMKMWQLLDPAGKYNNVYNRYSHVVVLLTDQDTNFKLNGPDAFTINLNVKDLPKTGIKYILSTGDLERFAPSLKQVYFEPTDNLYIYQVAQS
jgi:hypothetical protein